MSLRWKEYNTVLGLPSVKQGSDAFQRQNSRAHDTALIKDKQKYSWALIYHLALDTNCRNLFSRLF